MSAIFNPRHEPVRTYIYGVVLAALAVAGFYGLVTSEAMPFLAALASAILAVPAVEKARSKVSPVNEEETW